jgi:hypothetical protein
MAPGGRRSAGAAAGSGIAGGDAGSGGFVDLAASRARVLFDVGRFDLDD